MNIRKFIGVALIQLLAIQTCLSSADSKQTNEESTTVTIACHENYLSKDTSTKLTISSGKKIKDLIELWKVERNIPKSHVFYAAKHNDNELVSSVAGSTLLVFRKEPSEESTARGRSYSYND